MMDHDGVYLGWTHGNFEENHVSDPTLIGWLCEE